MDASIYLKPPFEGLAETVTHRHLSAAAISKGVSVEAARYLLIEKTGLPIAPDPKLGAQARKLVFNDMLRDFNLQNTVFTEEEPLVGIGNLPTEKEVVARLGNIFADIKRANAAGQFSYIANVGCGRVKLQLRTFGGLAKLSVGVCEIHFFSHATGDQMGMIKTNNILCDWGPYNHRTTREFVGGIWHSLWLGQLAATFLRDQIE
ncbi:hypothetical protein [uncultured Litoreibacter sp.]|uniref:hypothetical protein n=1 Tax=uncultured Litoreibacter sp. TaxID=1392394 RepID=UPI002620B89A|nr:hypothetical protein [uncultured Litoreibacter sp.]